MAYLSVATKGERMKFLSRLFVFSIYALLYLPILILILYSVNKARFSLQWQGWSYQWYLELFQDERLWTAFLNSVFLGILASGLATIASFFTSCYLFLSPSREKKNFFATLVLLIIIPDLVFGVALLVFFNLISLTPGFLSLLIAHITFCIPFTIFTIYARMKTMNRDMYYSALDLGANRRIALRKILLPLLWPAILSAFLLGFTLSFDDVIISYFVAGPNFPILPLALYSLVRTGVTPELNALCSITFFISMIFVMISWRLTGKPA